MQNNKIKYIDVLQILRGIAALMVVLHHSVGSIRYYHKINYPWLNFLGAIGKYGVDFFFVLSGFIISYSAFYKYNEPNAFKKYVLNRLVRIYIPYLPIGIFLLICYSLVPNFSSVDRNISSFTSLTLIPYGNPALSVAWTLSFELFFYLVFSITFFSKKIWHYFLIGWFIVIIVGNYFVENAINSLNPLLKIVLSLYNFEFILGYLLAQIIIKNIKVNLNLTIITTFLLTILFLFVKLYEIKLFSFDLNLLFAFIIFLLLYIAINKFTHNFDKNSIVMMIGNATYSIYLIHNPLQMIVLRLFPRIHSILGLLTGLFLVFLTTFSIGYAYYLVFEKKMITIIKTKLSI